MSDCAEAASAADCSTPSTDARAARLAKFDREPVLVGYLNRGVSMVEISAPPRPLQFHHSRPAAFSAASRGEPARGSPERVERLDRPENLAQGIEKVQSAPGIETALEVASLIETPRCALQHPSGRAAFDYAPQDEVAKRATTGLSATLARKIRCKTLTTLNPRPGTIGSLTPQRPTSARLCQTRSSVP